MEETIDLRELFKIIKRKIWMIILIGLIFGIVSGVVSVFFITPMYQSSTTLIVNKENSNSETQLSNSDDINYVQKLAYTYSEIITSRSVIGKTISQLGLDISYKKLASCVTVTNITNTQIIKVDVLYKDPKTAREICDTIPAVFVQEIQRIM